MSNIAAAFLLSSIAGLSTGIGSIIAFFAKKTNVRFLSMSLGFSAGVMIFISLVELYPSASGMLSSLGPMRGEMVAIASFFGGMLLISLIDRFIPTEDPHNMKFTVPEQRDTETKRCRLMRTGTMTAIALTIHNFPEGMATFVTALRNPVVALPIVFAISIHNIPEGIAVSAPIYYATGSRKKAFIYSLASGIAEPVGALIGYLILMPFLNDTVFGILYACVAGIMVFISLDELMPAAREYGDHHISVYGLLAGMFVLSVSMAMFF